MNSDCVTQFNTPATVLTPIMHTHKLHAAADYDEHWRVIYTSHLQYLMYNNKRNGAMIVDMLSTRIRSAVVNIHCLHSGLDH